MMDDWLLQATNFRKSVCESAVNKPLSLGRIENILQWGTFYEEVADGLLSNGLEDTEVKNILVACVHPPEIRSCSLVGDRRTDLTTFKTQLLELLIQNDKLDEDCYALVCKHLKNLLGPKEWEKFLGSFVFLKISTKLLHNCLSGICDDDDQLDASDYVHALKWIHVIASRFEGYDAGENLLQETVVHVFRSTLITERTVEPFLLILACFSRCRADLGTNTWVKLIPKWLALDISKPEMKAAFSTINMRLFLIAASRNSDFYKQVIDWVITAGNALSLEIDDDKFKWIMSLQPPTVPQFLLTFDSMHSFIKTLECQRTPSDIAPEYFQQRQFQAQSASPGMNVWEDM